MKDMYTVIAENDESQWRDSTGVVYHFPKRYLKYLEPGTNVIYYKGELKKKIYRENRLTDRAHYFGVAKIGEVYEDLESAKGDYYAEIIEYIPFSNPVTNKDITGEYIEEIPENKKKNYWRNGVRNISKSVYNKILESVGIEGNTTVKEIKLKEKDLPDIGSIKVNLVNDIFEEKQNDIINKSNENSGSNNNGKGSNQSNTRYSKNSKVIGDRAEEIVFEYLKNNLDDEEKKSLEWLAKNNKTPGYDVSYFNKNKEEICIEVKGTTGKYFTSFVITSNERNAAQKNGENYWVYLVADCLSKSPKIQKLNNPFLKEENNEIQIEPIAFKVTNLEI